MYIVVGLPGAGKSTVLSKFKEKNSEWRIIVYGTLMFEIAKEFGINDRDEMRKSSLELQRKIQKRVGEELSKIKEEKVILDTHAAIKTNTGYLPGLPFDVVKNLRVEGVILITAKAEEILERRERDKSRKRDKESKESIEQHDLINKAMCSSYAVLSGAPFSIVENREGKLEETVSELERILKG